jgi:hypothetical protein
MHDDIKIIYYDKILFPFRSCLSNILGTDDLENLHKQHNVTVDNIAEKTSSLRFFCEERIGNLQEVLKEFINKVVVELYGRIYGFQVLPTLRFHFAVKSPQLKPETEDITALSSENFLKKYYFNNQRLAMFHRDKDYGLTSGSVNLWIPVTKVWGANTLWLGGRDKFGTDSNPIELEYGQAIFFDGAFRWHGVVWNTTEITRVSLDIRFHPEKSFIQN